MHICLVLDKSNIIFLNSFLEALAINQIKCTPFIVDSSRDFIVQRNELLKLLQREDISYILSINEYYDEQKRNLYDDTILEQAKINVWYVDTMQHGEYMPNIVKKYNKIYTFEPTDIEYAKQLYDIDIEYLPFGAGRNLFASDYLTKQKSYEYDICFVGLVAGSTYRLSILNTIAQLCIKNNYKFALYGHFWHSNHYLQQIIGSIKFRYKYPDLYKYVHNQKLEPNKVVDLYRKSRICLNIHNQNHTGLNCRSFEIMGNGNFLLTDKKDTNRLNIKAGVDYEDYSNMEELINKISYFLCHDKERQCIALNGAACVRQNYTIDRLISKVIIFD